MDRKIEMASDLPEGTAQCCDQFGRVLAEIRVPIQPAPVGTVVLRLSPEDYGRFLKACAAQVGIEA